MSSVEGHRSYWLGIYRVISAVAGVLAVPILIGVKQTYDKIDMIGNRLTAVETTQAYIIENMTRIEKKTDQNDKDNKRVMEIYYTEIYPRFYGK